MTDKAVRAYWRAEKAAQRLERVAAGMCPNHPNARAITGRLFCSPCLVYWRERGARVKSALEAALVEPEEGDPP